MARIYNTEELLMPETSPNDWAPSEPLRQFSVQRDPLVEELERQSDHGEINVNQMVRRYSGTYDQPVLTLLEHMQTQIAVYYNVVEELKKSTSPRIAAELKERYVSLGLIPIDNQWPNPSLDGLMRLIQASE
jgi:hypothetical protein